VCAGYTNRESKNELEKKAMLTDDDHQSCGVGGCDGDALCGCLGGCCTNNIDVSCCFVVVMVILAGGHDDDSGDVNADVLMC
jgi:hypothetical protein